VNDKDHPDGICSAIYGFDNADGDGSMIYIGCHTYDPNGMYATASWCTHPKTDNSFCDWADSSEIPDGWVECAGQCDCPSHLEAKDCPAGSDLPECCCNFPASNPCEGLDESTCTNVNQPLCYPVMGATVAEPNTPTYLGCRSQCAKESAHGPPTCTHPLDDGLNCDIAMDARIPDGWSTDCSMCSPAPPQ
jgi:hypothetical protein